jgi:hypothetical protein
MRTLAGGCNQQSDFLNVAATTCWPHAGHASNRCLFRPVEFSVTTDIDEEESKWWARQGLNL